eukprot:scaffold5551_cov119-Isochrysis_galbana.AAC.6
MTGLRPCSPHLFTLASWAAALVPAPEPPCVRAPCGTEKNVWRFWPDPPNTKKALHASGDSAGHPRLSIAVRVRSLPLPLPPPSHSFPTPSPYSGRLLRTKN